MLVLNIVDEVYDLLIVIKVITVKLLDVRRLLHIMARINMEELKVIVEIYQVMSTSRPSNTNGAKNIAEIVLMERRWSDKMIEKSLVITRKIFTNMTFKFPVEKEIPDLTQLFVFLLKSHILRIERLLSSKLIVGTDSIEKFFLKFRFLAVTTK